MLNDVISSRAEYIKRFATEEILAAEKDTKGASAENGAVSDSDESTLSDFTDDETSQMEL